MRVDALDAAPADAIAATFGSAVAKVVVTPTSAGKCVRCWHHRPDVGTHASHPELCGRCVANVDGPGEVRHWF